MINYNKLFDVAYSNIIPESVKDSILDSVLESIGEKLNEDLQTEGSRCVGILETLAFSNMSCPLVNSIIDKAFAGLNEDFINEVSDAFIHKAAKSALRKREAAVKRQEGYGNRPIGLVSLDKQAKERERAQHAQDVVNKTEAPKPSALDRLKGAVNKVKQAWGSNNKPVGLSSFKSSNPSIEEIKKSDAEIRDHAVKMGTGDGSKASNIKPATASVSTETPTSTAAPTAKPKATTKAKATTKSKATTKAKSTKKASSAASNIAANIKQAEEVKPAPEPEKVKAGRKKKVNAK